ncbi:hypothetical protein NNL19_02930 [Riemerella anatipestifer]|uniref:hypothetical protein n=1 Tax=Riemerella anatipestifer TaxID=34085 RepID=UPI0012AEB12B|nr:hypothetical protein [Riemerella anatipestifer]MCQ4154553.1 hypothetical protein [Riemerella anatipestifer]MCQ4180546.1 hypothetical protein [Riemerella anatipestifer]MDR7793422.1 hypothetical protein [Riemerella anatipestifer]MRQ21851.1 hypothetical protein [Riemerella anatipestifer]
MRALLFLSLILLLVSCRKEEDNCNCTKQTYTRTAELYIGNHKIIDSTEWKPIGEVEILSGCPKERDYFYKNDILKVYHDKGTYLEQRWIERTICK